MGTAQEEGRGQTAPRIHRRVTPVFSFKVIPNPGPYQSIQKSYQGHTKSIQEQGRESPFLTSVTAPSRATQTNPQESGSCFLKPPESCTSTNPNGTQFPLAATPTWSFSAKRTVRGSTHSSTCSVPKGWSSKGVRHGTAQKLQEPQEYQLHIPCDLESKPTLPQACFAYVSSAFSVKVACRVPNQF